MRDLDRVIAIDPDLAEAWYTRGLVHEYKGDYDAAIKHYRQVLEIDDDFEKARSQLAIVEEKKRNPPRASASDEEDRRREERRKDVEEVVEAFERSKKLSQQKTDSSPPWRETSERRKLMDFLSRFGRVLTTPSANSTHIHSADGILRSLVRTLCKRTRRNLIVLGHPGTGKSTVVRELAYRIVHRHPSIPRRLLDADIFELSPVFLQADSKYLGEYEEKVRDLLRVLEKSPNVILFVDEVHSFFQSAVYDSESTYNRANEAFKRALSEGLITVIGCTTPVEYRHFIEPDQALARRFSIVRLEPPTTQMTENILRARRPRIERHYETVTIPDEIICKAVTLTDDRLPGRYQPDKSLQLIDEACAYCITENPPLTTVTEDVLLSVLEDITGRSIVRTEQLSESSVFQTLKARIYGHDEVLAPMARAVVAGLGKWARGGGPRGVFLFGGPTGVGKTETAIALAELLGGGRDALVRIDCNTIQGTGHGSTTAVHRLLGVPPGLVGYARGQGGTLSRVRDLPESVVLFDEFEKADPSVGKLLLQIIDEGRVEDTDGSLLDFHRSFLIFTTNAGTIYQSDHDISFRHLDAVAYQPTIDEDGLRVALQDLGIGPEFLGRVSHTFLFQSLERREIMEILRRRLNELDQAAELRGLDLRWSDDVLSHLAAQWQPRYGVRHLSSILRNRIVEQLNLADAQGEFRGVNVIYLEVDQNTRSPQAVNLSGCSTRERRAEKLVIRLS